MTAQIVDTDHAPRMTINERLDVFIMRWVPRVQQAAAHREADALREAIARAIQEGVHDRDRSELDARD